MDVQPVNLPMGRHDTAVMSSEEAPRSFERFVQSEQDMLALLQRRLEVDQQMLASMRKPGP